jgi:hypothetical protein
VTTTAKAFHGIVTPALLTALLLAGGLAVPSTVAAATYYVATTGSDSNAGTSDRPFRTITFAYARAAAGDEIIVKPGVYTDYTASYGLRLNRSGTASAPITLRSEKRGAAVLDGGNRTDRPDVVWFSGNYNVLDGFDIKNGYLGGIMVYGSYNQIRNNAIHHNGNVGDPKSTKGQDGIYSGSSTTGNVYWANHIHHNGRISIDSNYDHGLYLTGDNELVANNIVTHNSAYGVHLAGYTVVSNSKVYNNVLAWNGRSGIMLWMDFAGVDIRNNILVNNRNYGIDTYKALGTGIQIDRNIVYGNGAGTMRLNGLGSILSYLLGSNPSVDPKFTNASAGDFRLQSTSPGVDAGVKLSAVPIDFASIPRPQGTSHDIGAHEFHVQALAPPTNVRVIRSSE